MLALSLAALGAFESLWGLGQLEQMGITNVGGMITSGILTLYIIPMMFVLFHHIQNWIMKKKPADNQGLRIKRTIDSYEKKEPRINTDKHGFPKILD
jgi:hypothetical protein